MFHLFAGKNKHTYIDDYELYAMCISIFMFSRVPYLETLTTRYNITPFNTRGGRQGRHTTKAEILVSLLCLFVTICYGISGFIYLYKFDRVRRLHDFITQRSSNIMRSILNCHQATYFSKHQPTIYEYIYIYI